MANIELYDTTLRDGAGMEGISFSVEDKLKIVEKLDQLGVRFIEGGYPGSNPKDAEFFVRAQNLRLKNARLAAFGSTRRAGGKAESDPILRSLVDAHTPVVTIVGKASEYQVRTVLETTLEENLAMVADSIRYLKAHVPMVFYDAEHFFDGFFANPEYSLQCLRVAQEAGVDCIPLCDTNGGTITTKIVEAVRAAQEAVSVPLGIHTHNDADLAVANTLAAIEAGVQQVQGCINGYGERCGNANLTSIIPALKLKMGIDCVGDEQLARLTEISHYISEIANMVPASHAPYVGVSAFAHKAGLHVAAVVKDDRTFEHIDPELVGNQSRVLVSELGGHRNIITKMKEQGIDIPLSPEEARGLLEKVKQMESRGYQYEGAEASFELLIRRNQAGYEVPFELEDFWVVERRGHKKAGDATETVGEPGPGEIEMQAEAMVKVSVGDQIIQTAADGNGPVNALDAAARKALVEFYPSLAAVKLVDYKVRIIDTAAGTGAGVRVLIESTDGERLWRTVGSSTDIIEASWLALADSLEWWLMRRAAPTAE
jgi:2-isopropylmalate synthase